MVKNVGSDLIWPPTMKCIHAWHSCLKFLLLPSCTAPITAFSLLFLVMTGTIALYPSADVFFFFLLLCVLLCCAQRMRVKWGRKRANAHNCSLCWECMRLQMHSVQNPSSFTWDRRNLSVCKPFHYGRSGNCLFLCGAEWALKEWGIKPPTCIPLWRTNAIYHKDSDYHRRRFMFVLVGAQNLTWHAARVSAT